MDRYSRQTILDNIGSEGQDKLLASSVLIIGLGGLGCPAAQLLVGAGIGTIGLMDGDKVHISNLHRQTLYNELDLGKSKVLQAKEHLSKMNTEIKLVTHDEFLSQENGTEILSQYKIILDCTDNIPSRLLINDICCTIDKSWVYGGIRQFEGQIAVFNYKNGPSYRCLFPGQVEQIPSCMMEGVLGVVPGIIGSYMANEALKILLEIGEPLTGKVKVVNMLNNETMIYSLPRNPSSFL